MVHFRACLQVLLPGVGAVGHEVQAAQLPRDILRAHVGLRGTSVSPVTHFKRTLCIFMSMACKRLRILRVPLLVMPASGSNTVELEMPAWAWIVTCMGTLRCGDEEIHGEYNMRDVLTRARLYSEFSVPLQ